MSFSGQGEIHWKTACRTPAAMPRASLPRVGARKGRNRRSTRPVPALPTVFVPGSDRVADSCLAPPPIPTRVLPAAPNAGSSGRRAGRQTAVGQTARRQNARRHPTPTEVGQCACSRAEPQGLGA